jgi:hypothetical protein
MPPSQALIASRFEEWGSVPAVLRELFEDPSPANIAAALERFCARSLSSRIAHAEFFEAGVGSAHGVLLADGSRVVIKLHRPDRSIAFLRAAQAVQRVLAESGFPCPRPLVGPEPLGAGLASAESLLDEGEYADAHEPAVRRAMATSLARLVDRCRPFVRLPGLGENAMKIPPGELWPIPHDGRFDFAATTAGAEWIDDSARRARMILDGTPSGDTVVGHTDWRAQNMRFAGEEISAIYDWDSLAVEREPALVGSVAHGFTSNWAQPPVGRQLPTLEEAEGFISDYEDARGAVFSLAERRAARAALVYSMTYTARCGHSDALTDFGRHPPLAADLPSHSADEARTFLGEHATRLLSDRSRRIC